MCSNPSKYRLGVHTRPVGESEKTSSVVVVYRNPQCIYLSLWHLSVLPNDPYTKGSMLDTIHPARNYKIGSLWEPWYLSSGGGQSHFKLCQVASLALLHRSWWWRKVYDSKTMKVFFEHAEIIGFLDVMFAFPLNNAQDYEPFLKEVSLANCPLSTTSPSRKRTSQATTR